MKRTLYREIHKERLDLNVVIYGKTFYHIGGIESWVVYVCKRYNIGQITLLYDAIDAPQLERFKKVVNCVQYTGQEFHCNKIIYVAPIYVQEDELWHGAKEHYLINHVCYGDSKNTEVFELPEFDKVFAVSDFCAESCRKRITDEIFTLYNPVEIEKPKKVLRLVSACRWSKDKGSEQMLKLAEMLDKANISFIWYIFTDEEPEEHHRNMIFMTPRYDLASIIADCDWGVQFSRIESYGLFPVECLKCGTPVILTDLKVFREIGIDERNAFFFDWDMKEKDVRLLQKPPKVKYKEPNSDKIYKELLK